MNNQPFTWTDELAIEFAAYTNKQASAFTGRYTDLENFKRERSQPSLSEGIVNAIHELKYADRVGNIRTFEYANRICDFKGKRDWIQRRLIENGGSIYSVKTDEGIFTVKETCTNEAGIRYNNGKTYTIKEFRQPTHGERDCLVAVYECGGEDYIDVLRKPFKLQCEDGVVTNPEQRVYRVSPIYRTVSDTEFKAREATKTERSIWFTTEKAAKSYVSRNEKRYSEADIEKVLDKFSIDGWVLLGKVNKQEFLSSFTKHATTNV